MKPKGNRNLFNMDCTDLFFGSRPAGERFHAGVLHDYVQKIARSGADTYLCNPNAQKPWYPSRVLPSILEGYTRGDREFFRGHFPPPNDTDFPAEMLENLLDKQPQFLDRYLDLQEDGVDWVKEVSLSCRENQIAPWLSVRMNDGHGANSWENSYMNCALQRDPKYRLRGKSINPRDGNNRFFQLLNYEHRAVRDYYFAQIRELVEDYDYEGLELDWTRMPLCCEPEASQKTCDMMTDWIGEIRALCRDQSRKIGKPYPLGLRIPVRLDQLKTIGLDVRAMARRDLVDFVCPTNMWQTTWDVPQEELRKELGDEVAIYGVVEDAPNWMNAYSPRDDKKSYRLLSSSPELLRGNAAGKLASGADGVETFNFFCSDDGEHNPNEQCQRAEYSALRDLHDLEKLRGQPKHYCFQGQSGNFSDAAMEYGEQIPFVLQPQWRRALKLPMCAETGALHELTIQIVIEKTAATPDLGVAFNGSWPNFDAQPTDELVMPTGIYTHHIETHTAFNFCFDANRIKEGWNEIVVYNGAPAEAGYSVCIVSVELAVR